jgi:hypothetical protein
MCGGPEVIRKRAMISWCVCVSVCRWSSRRSCPNGWRFRSNWTGCVCVCVFEGSFLDAAEGYRVIHVGVRVCVCVCSRSSWHV